MEYGDNLQLGPNANRYMPRRLEVRCGATPFDLSTLSRPMSSMRPSVESRTVPFEEDGTKRVTDFS